MLREKKIYLNRWAFYTYLQFPFVFLVCTYLHLAFAFLFQLFRVHKRNFLVEKENVLCTSCLILVYWDHLHTALCRRGVSPKINMKRKLTKLGKNFWPSLKQPPRLDLQHTLTQWPINFLSDPQACVRSELDTIPF